MVFPKAFILLKLAKSCHDMLRTLLDYDSNPTIVMVIFTWQVSVPSPGSCEGNWVVDQRLLTGHCNC